MDQLECFHQECLIKLEWKSARSGRMKIAKPPDREAPSFALSGLLLQSLVDESFRSQRLVLRCLSFLQSIHTNTSQAQPCRKGKSACLTSIEIDWGSTYQLSFERPAVIPASRLQTLKACLTYSLRHHSSQRRHDPAQHNKTHINYEQETRTQKRAVLQAESFIYQHLYLRIDT